MIENKISIDDWFDLVCQSYLRPPVNYNGLSLPSFPPDVIQTNTTGQSGVATLKEAFIFYKDCVESFKSFGRPIEKSSRVLDFGVGWGRVARFFLKNVQLENLHGLDVMPEFIDICKNTFQSQNFTVCQPLPPTAFPDNHFDFIVGYSVFSHLSENVCVAWMKEFQRILAPGGIVALTTRGRHFFDYCESLDPNLTGYAGALREMFVDFNDARARYDRGEFVHSNVPGVSGGGTINETFYGETFIPEGYAINAYPLRLEKFMFEPSYQSHPIMFFRK